MKRVIKLTESQLESIVKRVIQEQQEVSPVKTNKTLQTQKKQK